MGGDGTPASGLGAGSSRYPKSLFFSSGGVSFTATRESLNV
jgi:hypothetical protein